MEKTGTIRSRETLLNMTSGLLLQLSLILSGLILPRLLLRCFGSETNGLVASIDQFLRYIALAEGGMTAVVTACLYGPLVRKDRERLSSLLVATRLFYRKLGGLFLLYSLALALIYPLAMGLNLGYTASLILLLSGTHLLRYLVSQTWQVLLAADKKQYVVSFLQTAITLLGALLSWLSVRIRPEIHLMLGVNGVLYLLQPAVLAAYVRRRYAIDWKAAPDRELRKNRRNGFAINLAAFVHHNTDVAVLTLFTNLPTVSVYSVYALATAGLKAIVTSLANSLNPVLGYAWARGDRKDLNEKLDAYEALVLLLVGFFFTAGGLLITSFARLYTRGVQDAPYDQPVFGLLLVLAEALYLLKLPHLNLAYAANRFREITGPACTEAAINIGISLILVKPLGLSGVAIGTAAAMLYRLVFHVSFTARLIPGRLPGRTYKRLLLTGAVSMAGAALCRLAFPAGGETISGWILQAVGICAILGAVFAVFGAASFRKEAGLLIRYLKHGGTVEREEEPEIDLVCLYVNPADKAWAERRKQYGRNTVNEACRDRDNGELRYLLRSAEKYAPWIRRIFIVTDSAPPDWLNPDSPKIRIVDHREIIPAEILPCYNSNVIESFLSRIPDLSEIFLYANDDMFFGNTVTPDFFVRDGKPVIRMMKTSWDPSNPKDYYEKALRNAHWLIRERFGKEYRLIPWHNIDVYSKTAFEACRRDFAEELARVSRNRLRAEDDLQRVLFHDWLLANDACVLKVYDRTSRIGTAMWYLRAVLFPDRYFDFAIWYLPDFFRMPVLRRLFRRGPRCVCLNDGETATEADLEHYRAWMRKAFPEPCAMEKESVSQKS